MTDTMQRWTMDTLGREHLQLTTEAVPQPGPHEIRVKVKAVALNYRDKMMIESGMGLTLPQSFTPASDMAGEVDAIGPGVSRFQPGARVISTFSPGWLDGRQKPYGDARQVPYHTLGGFYQGVLAEYVILHEDWLVAAPTSLDDAQASTLPCAGLTAWFALVEQGKLHAGETVLVQGTGGVALFALQIAKALMATSKLDVTFRGVASHAGAKPEDGRNALLAAAQAALGLYAIPRHSEGSSRINVGVLQAGTGRNVIADRAFMKVETRGATNEINTFVYQQALNAIEGAAKMHGVACDIALMGAAQSSKPTQPWVDYIRRQAQQITELTSVVDRREQAAGSEDATYMMERVKSRGGQASYVIFGTELSAGHHNEKFDFNEQVMAVAVKTLASLALNLPTFGSGA